MQRLAPATVAEWAPAILVSPQVTDHERIATFIARARAAYAAPEIVFGEPQPMLVTGLHFAVITQGAGLVDASMHTIGRFAWHQLFARTTDIRINPAGDDQPPLIAADSGYGNYYHWTAESLGAMLVHRAVHPGGGAIPLVVPALDGWRGQVLDLFSIGNRLIELDTAQAAVFDAARLTNLASRDYSFAPHPSLLREFQAQLPDLPGSDASAERIYVARLDADQRRMANEPELCAMLASRGFRIVTAGALPVAEQAALFRNAGLIVAPHGAALTNLFYARDGRHGPRVVELLQENYPGRGYVKLCQGKGLDYTAIINPCLERSHHHHSSTWQADIGLVETLLKDLGVA